MGPNKKAQELNRVRITVGKNGVAFIPKEFRERLGIEGGGYIYVHVKDGALVITKAEPTSKQ